MAFTAKCHECGGKGKYTVYEEGDLVTYKNKKGDRIVAEVLSNHGHGKHVQKSLDGSGHGKNARIPVRTSREHGHHGLIVTPMIWELSLYEGEE